MPNRSAGRNPKSLGNAQLSSAFRPYIHPLDSTKTQNYKGDDLLELHGDAGWASPVVAVDAAIRRGNRGVIYSACMTKLLEKAIEKVRELPAEDQDTVAVAVLSMTEEKAVVLDDETRMAIREGLEQARRAEFVPEEEIDALWKQHGL
jgi:hypothetical protein